MRLLITAVALTTFVTQAAARTLQVDVGQNGILYSPNTTQASFGDLVQFNFYNNHSVVESSFTSPCKPLANGFYSGFITSCLNCGVAPEHFIVTLKDKQPHYFYCSQSEHCYAGMVGVINPPSNQPNELVAYAIGAANTSPDASPNDISPHSAPIGGVIASITSVTGTETASSTSNPDPSFTFTLAGFNTPAPYASEYSPSSHKNTSTETRTVLTSSANTTATKSATTMTMMESSTAPTSPRSTVTNTAIVSASPSSTSSGSATVAFTSAAPSATTTGGSTRCGNYASLWLLSFVYLGVILYSAW